MISLRSLAACLAILSLTQPMFAQSAQTGTPENSSLAGYSSQSSKMERDWEKKLQAGIVPDNLRQNMQRLSARPHHVGSPYNQENANWMLSEFKEWGFDAHVETFQVLFPTPKERIVEMTEPTKFRAKLEEPAVPGDPTSNRTAEQLPTYNAYSIDGDVTARLVYVNYGNREDYEQLDRLGISVKGAIVIARYGGGWRGIKPKVAAEHQAIGCIIYSDPKGDGFFNGDEYPKGGWRPRDGVQRGAVTDTDYPGDPLTPGVGATAGVKRLEIKDAKVITKIPVLPISYGEALPLLSALQGSVAPEGWRGALPITYHVGPGPAKVHLKVLSNWDLKPVNDVIATLRGSDAPDEWVIRGNHYDAWVNGAEDPISGMVAVLEEARVLGELHKQGWNPKRTIVMCAGMAKSRGCWAQPSGSKPIVMSFRSTRLPTSIPTPIGEAFSTPGARMIYNTSLTMWPVKFKIREKHITVQQRRRLSQISGAHNAEERGEIRKSSDVRINALGDGSDYTAFLDYAGIAAVNSGYGGEAGMATRTIPSMTVSPGTPSLGHRFLLRQRIGADWRQRNYAIGGCRP